MRTIDLNADVGEGFATDAELIPLLTSANIACGGHAGDPESMESAARAAIEAGVAIGAHPGHEDREHFGRREIAVSRAGLIESLTRQVDRLHAIVAGLGGALGYLKPHGALYHQADRDPDIARAMILFLESFHTPLALLGPPRGELEAAADLASVSYFREAFADRAYQPDGSLAPRSAPGAVLTDESAVVRQAVRLARDGEVVTTSGTTIPVPCDSLCLHGDTPGAVHHARGIARALDAVGVRPLSFGHG